MENRFGLKDFLLIALLALVVAVILLAMKQYDRQYEIVRDIQQQGRDQLRELVGIRAAIERGGLSNVATSRPSSTGPDGFAALRKLTDYGKYNQGDWFVQNFPVQIAKPDSVAQHRRLRRNHSSTRAGFAGLSRSHHSRLRAAVGDELDHRRSLR